MSAPADEFKPTQSATVHAVVTCEECDFRAQWYLDAVQKGKEHHAQTGHELTGEIGRAVWIGETGREMNRAKTSEPSKACPTVCVNYSHPMAAPSRGPT